MYFKSNSPFNFLWQSFCNFLSIFSFFFQADVDGNKNSLDFVLWIRARSEGQNLNGTIDLILTRVQAFYFLMRFQDGSIMHLKTASICQDLKCDNKTETVIAKIPPTTSTTTTTITTTPTTTTTTTTPTTTTTLQQLQHRLQRRK